MRNRSTRRALRLRGWLHSATILATGAFAASFALAHSGWLAVCAISVVAAAAALGVQLLAMRRAGRARA